MCSSPPLWKPRRGRKIQNGVFGVSKAQSPGCDTSFNQQMVAFEGSAAAAAMVRVRGGYTRWTPEERLLIAKACIRMGPNKAARELSRTLNKKLSKSTVQNIHKQYLERLAKRQLVNAPLSLPQGRQGQWEEDIQPSTGWFGSCLSSLEASAALFLLFFWEYRHCIYGWKGLRNSILSGSKRTKCGWWEHLEMCSDWWWMDNSVANVGRTTLLREREKDRDTQKEKQRRIQIEKILPIPCLFCCGRA